MTDTNRYGPGVSLRDVRRWAIAGIGLWFPAYLRDAERHHGLAEGYCDLPNGFRLNPQDNAAEAVPERTKHPETQLPVIMVVSPGLTETEPRLQPDRTFMTEWALTLMGVVKGISEDDAELVASVYGLAIVQMFNQQAGAWADLDDYAGPALTVEDVRWATPGLDFTTIEASRRRSVVAAEANFSVVFRNAANRLGPDGPPPVDPVTDPGPWAEIVTTELDITREGS